VLRRSVLLVVAVGLALAGCGPLPAYPPLVSGFTDEVVLQGLNQPTAVEFAADGRVFVAEKRGVVKVFDGLEDTTPTTFADLRTNVLNHWDRGLLGLALAPGFPADPYVYVLYTYDALPGGTAPHWGSPGVNSDPCPTPPGFTDDGCVATGRLSRLRAAGNVMTGAEQVLVQGWCQQFPGHSVGTVAFGPDGALYAGSGEGAAFTGGIDYGQRGDPLNPCGDPPGGAGAVLTPPTAEGGSLRAQDLRTAGDPVGLSGSIIRVDPATGAGLAGNPLSASTDANARRIVAYGFRNPFRFTFRPGTSEIWVGDVGWNTWEELDRVPSPAAPLENFGWPCYEGSPRQGNWDAANLRICEDLYATTGAVTAPRYAYRFSDRVAENDACDPGRALSGVAFYRGGAYPDRYDGALFFADYSRKCISVVLPGADGAPDLSRREVFASSAAVPVELQTGPGGDLFYVDFGGAVHRISYSANAVPQAVLLADPVTGPPPLTVGFDGRWSSDPDRDALSYAWDLDGDGAFDDGTASQATWTYGQAGVVTARLRVSDGHGGTATASRAIVVGHSPTAIIDTPVAGTRWSVGDTISFSGRGTDADEGTLASSALAWALVLHHCTTATACHAHPLGTFDGSTGSFVAPDHEYPSYLELVLTATDRTGLSSSTSRRLDPNPVTMTITSDPAGIPLTVGGGTVSTPATVPLIVGSETTVGAPSAAVVGGRQYAFRSWSDRGAISHDVVAPPSPFGLTAVYAPK
jgi:glucose/arabinose dehydrogenase